MYIVIKAFVDLEDRKRPYEPGEIYPRPGGNPTKARIEALLTNRNKAGEPLIREKMDDVESVIEFVKPPESDPDATDAD